MLVNPFDHCFRSDPAMPQYIVGVLSKSISIGIDFFLLSIGCTFPPAFSFVKKCWHIARIVCVLGLAEAIQIINCNKLIGIHLSSSRISNVLFFRCWPVCCVTVVIGVVVAFGQR